MFVLFVNVFVFVEWIPVACLWLWFEVAYMFLIDEP